MTVMPLLEGLQHWTQAVLTWIRFGTVVGLSAKGILPGKDRGGAVATLLMGITGSVIGLGALAYFWEGHHVSPVSVTGFLAATAGASVLLLCHRMLQGSFFREEGTGKPGKRAKRREVVVRQG